MVLFEATAARVPVVATAVGGIPAVLGEGLNLVRPADPRALATALERVLGSRPTAEDAIARARESVEGPFSERAWIARHLELYGIVRGNGVGRQCPEATERRE